MSSNQNKAGIKPSLQMYHYVVQSSMRFDWDSEKESANIKKHSVSFEDAKEAFNCGLVVVLKETHQNGEERFVYIGLSKKLNVLVVVVAYPDENVTRIISARKANKKERKFYEA
jgi:uncharacterized DUF497 family protein